MLLSFFFSNSAYAIDLEDIIKRSNQAVYFKGDSFKSKIEIINKIKNGSESNLEFLFIRKDNKDDIKQKLYIEFLSPIDMTETKLLVDNYRVKTYFPSFEMVKDLNFQDKHKSFFGSSFSYEDIIGFNPENYRKELLKNTDRQYIIKLTPKVPEGNLKYFISYIDNINLMPKKMVFFDNDGKIYRKKTIETIKAIDGYRTATEIKVIDYNKKQTSFLYLSNVEYDQDFPDNLFQLK